ncbi:MAG: SAM-dependent methyltransferase [Bacteroidetes bacterium]|nr:MAG: SAM-dependent methyltransferase [Bacteroidota bacterium]
MEFTFQKFSLNHSSSSMKIGTDAILLGAFAAVEEADHILEIGTGSGIIALMLAQRSKGRITAIDIHAPSVAQSKANIAHAPWSHRMKVLHTSLQAFTPPERFDHIVSNPPFFSHALKSNNETRNLARHNDNLTPEALAYHTHRLLTPEGTATFILPSDNISPYKQAFEQEALFPSHIITIRPKPHKNPNRIILQLKKRKGKTRTTSFTVRATDGRYSQEYHQLTKDFHP